MGGPSSRHDHHSFNTVTFAIIHRRYGRHPKRLLPRSGLTTYYPTPLPSIQLPALNHYPRLMTDVPKLRPTWTPPHYCQKSGTRAPEIRHGLREMQVGKTRNRNWSLVTLPAVCMGALHFELVEQHCHTGIYDYLSAIQADANAQLPGATLSAQ